MGKFELACARYSNESSCHYRYQERLTQTTMTSRKERQRQNYLDGVARRPHSHSRTLRESLEETGPAQGADEPPRGAGVCPQCYPILSRYTDAFKLMMHSGTELKKRKRRNPYPKADTDFEHYRDITKQNDWLRSNMFDCVGNYLYCSNCIKVAFEVSNDRLARQRSIKRNESKNPTVVLTKAEIEEKRLSEYVIMPTDVEASFKRWWRGVSPSANLEVRYPHSRHGNAGKTSNSAKSSVKEDFLSFVDINSQPNGRSADSSGPTFYFLAKFTTIQSPKKDVANYEQRVQRSVVGEFNRSQRERERGECSNSLSHYWLKERPKVAISPHQTDYCDTCKKRNIEIHAKQTTINRLLQSSNADPEEVKIEDDMTAIKQSLENHRQEAQGAHTYYLETTKRCKNEWDKIIQLSKTNLEQ